jgi:hypothetical protein
MIIVLPVVVGRITATTITTIAVVQVVLVVVAAVATIIIETLRKDIKRT